MGRSQPTKHGIIARPVGGTFSPNRPRQRLNHRQYSPAALTTMISTATACGSFEDAARLLTITAELTITPRHLQTLCQEVGGELVAEHRAQTAAFQSRPLMTPSKTGEPPIPLATVMIDGGRMQTRQPDQGPGVHGQAWRETKTAILLRMTCAPSDHDPQPELPACFAHPLGTRTTDQKPPPKAIPVSKPETLFRTGIATLENSDGFGWMTAAAAEERGFFTANAKAFVSDGLPYNWSIQRRHFATFEPILDFVHASEHLHNAAKAIGDEDGLGHRWAELCWQGRVSEILAELREQRDRLTPPLHPDDELDHPWCVLRREQGYIENNQKRMDYPRYRRAGLTITSSPVESWVKQLNQRVKGSEKFWNDDQNAETMLHLRAAWLGDDEELAQHLRDRPGHPYARPRQREKLRVAA